LAIREALEAGRDTTIVIRNFKEDGSLFYNELHISPVRDSSAITHFIGIQLDVSDRMNSERSTSAYIEPDKNL
jgi:PAS domain S-box-containing protein